jgi:hypothetical protein
MSRIIKLRRKLRGYERLPAVLRGLFDTEMCFLRIRIERLKRSGAAKRKAGVAS